MSIDQHDTTLDQLNDAMRRLKNPDADREDLDAASADAFEARQRLSTLAADSHGAVAETVPEAELDGDDGVAWPPLTEWNPLHEGPVHPHVRAKTGNLAG